MSLTRGMTHHYPSRLTSQLFFRTFFDGSPRTPVQTEHRRTACAPNGLAARCGLGETGRKACLAHRQECLYSGIRGRASRIESAVRRGTLIGTSPNPGASPRSGMRRWIDLHAAPMELRSIQWLKSISMSHLTAVAGRTPVKVEC